jgi:hypothetical protein
MRKQAKERSRVDRGTPVIWKHTSMRIVRLGETLEAATATIRSNKTVRIPGLEEMIIVALAEVRGIARETAVQ